LHDYATKSNIILNILFFGKFCTSDIRSICITDLILSNHEFQSENLSISNDRKIHKNFILLSTERKIFPVRGQQERLLLISRQWKRTPLRISPCFPFSAALRKIYEDYTESFSSFPSGRKAAS